VAKREDVERRMEDGEEDLQKPKSSARRDRCGAPTDQTHWRISILAADVLLEVISWR
jgi:hypothetical protein